MWSSILKGSNSIERGMSLTEKESDVAMIPFMATRFFGSLATQFALQGNQAEQSESEQRNCRAATRDTRPAGLTLNVVEEALVCVQ